MDNQARHRIEVIDPAGMLAVVPYLLGFHPANSLVVLLVRGGRIVASARTDLPPFDTPDRAAELAGWCTAFAEAATADQVEIVGYGPARSVAAVAAAAADVFPTAGRRLRHVLHVEGNRYVPILCRGGCCPPEPVTFDPTSSVVAAQATYAGLVALPGRDAVAAQVAPISGAARQGMRQATHTARARLQQLVTGVDRGPAGREQARARVAKAGAAAVRDAFHRPLPLPDEQAAWLSVLLASTTVRDHAWRLTTGSPDQLHLWADLTRRAEPDLVAAPASLCAFAAWRTGNGVPARFAIERALHADPTYRMANLMRALLNSPIPPHQFDAWTELAP